MTIFALHILFFFFSNKVRAKTFFLDFKHCLKSKKNLSALLCTPFCFMLPYFICTTSTLTTFVALLPPFFLLCSSNFAAFFATHFLPQSGAMQKKKAPPGQNPPLFFVSLIFLHSKKKRVQKKKWTKFRWCGVERSSPLLLFFPKSRWVGSKK